MSFTVIAGPCAVEGPTQIERLAGKVSERGIDYLRGGAFKPRTEPDSFQGHGIQGLRWMRKAADVHDLKVVSEVIDVRLVDEAREYIDVVQIGSRSMQNVPLLRECAKAFDAMLLKRHFGSTLREWRGALDYVRHADDSCDVALCARGIRAHAAETRFTLDLAGARLIQEQTSAKVIVDPSHATGRPDLVVPMARAAHAAGLDGVIVECHDCPEEALCDAEQAATLDQIATINELSEE